jgi:hypothetical protein
MKRDGRSLLAAALIAATMAGVSGQIPGDARAAVAAYVSALNRVRARAGADALEKLLTCAESAEDVMTRARDRPARAAGIS